MSEQIKGYFASPTFAKDEQQVTGTLSGTLFVFSDLRDSTVAR